MQTLKTALVVVALLAALVVAYQVLNNQPIGLPLELGGAEGYGPEGGAEEVAAVDIEAPPLATFDAETETSAPPPMPSGFPNASVAISSATTPSTPVTPPPTAATFGAKADPFKPTDPAEATQTQHLAAETAPTTPPAALESKAADDSPASEPPSPLAAEESTPQSASSEEETSAAPVERTSDERPLPRYASPAVAKYAFERAWHKAELHVGDGELARALLILTAFYRHPDLNEESHKQLNERLDQLAGTVIYSTRHLLEEPYKVQRGETLQEIAARYNVPVRLLQNINGVEDPNLVLPNTELKVLRGPFRAEIDSVRGEMTLFLGNLYAGRFAMRAGGEPAAKPGEYAVRDIQPGRTYYSPAGQMIAAGSPTNPYGQWWLDLGHDVSIHGSPESASAGPGCLGLSPRDAADVASILSVGSKVVIR